MDLLEVVKDYVEQGDTDFAILINGSWGSGKTYFLNHSLAPELEKLTCQVDGVEKNLEIVYVSLYGLRSADELQKKLFLEINPSFKSKGAKAAGFVLGKVLDKIGVGMKDEDHEQLISIFGGVPKNKVLVFDDLERLSSATLNEVLGFINTYTEHLHLKVIIIADEAKLKAKLTDYETIKEKLIRFTYLYNPDLEEVFPELLSHYDSEDYRAYLLDNGKFICKLFNKGGHKNLRSLRFVLDLFKRVYTTVVGLHMEEAYRSEILKRFLFFFVTYSIAYKKGATEQELDSLDVFSSEVGNPFDRNLFKDFFSPQEDDDTLPLEGVEKFKDEFEKTFLEEDSKLFQYFSFLAHYVYSGDLSNIELNHEVQTIRGKLHDSAVKQEYIALDRLNNCLLLNDEDLVSLIREVIGYVGEGRYQLGQYAGILRTLKNFENNQVEGIVVDEEVFEVFKAGMDEAAKKSDYKENISNGISLKDDHEMITRLEEYAIQLNKSLKLRQNVDLAHNILKLLQERNLQQFEELLLSEPVQSRPVFVEGLIPVKVFFELYSGFTNAEKVKVNDAFSSFSGRFINYGPNLKEELDFYKTLLQIANTEIQSKQGRKSLSTINFLKLKAFLVQAIRRLEAWDSNDFDDSE